MNTSGSPSGASGPAVPPPPSPPPDSPVPLATWFEGWPQMVRWVAGFYGLVTLFAFGFALFSQHLGVFFGERAPTAAGVLGAVCVGLVVLGVVHLGTRVWPAISDGVRELASMIGPLRVRDAAVLAALSSVAEELLFRGALWPTLNGMLGTTLLFGLVHVVPRRALWGYPLYATFAGLLLGVLRAASGSVFLPIVAHFTINFGSLWWLSANYGRLTGRAPAPADRAVGGSPGMDSSPTPAPTPAPSSTPAPSPGGAVDDDTPTL